jgi:hypothetical protein
MLLKLSWNYVCFDMLGAITLEWLNSTLKDGSYQVSIPEIDSSKTKDFQLEKGRGGRGGRENRAGSGKKIHYTIQIYSSKYFH